MSQLDKYKCGNYGLDTLGNHTDRFMLRSFNNARKYYPNMLRIAADYWKKLYFQNLRVFKEKLVCVDPGMTTVRWPVDCLRIVGLNLVDNSGRKWYMEEDGKRNTAPLDLTTAKCGCKQCNCTSEACDGFAANTFQEEDVEIGGQTYKRGIKMRVCPSGDIMKEITEPYAIERNGEMVIEYRTKEEVIENVTVKVCGCVENTPVNLEKCYTLCHWPEPEECHNECPTLPRRPRGKYKADKDLRLIYIFDCVPKQVLIRYVSDGEDCGAEILIPEYAAPALYAGMYLGSIEFRLNIPAYEKRMAKIRYDEEVSELLKFMWPLDFEKIKLLQHKFPKW